MIAIILIIILILTAIFAGIWTAVGLGILGFIILSIIGVYAQRTNPARHYRITEEDISELSQ